jgi:hypothetical protein
VVDGHDSDGTHEPEKQESTNETHSQLLRSALIVDLLQTYDELAAIVREPLA